MKFPNTYFSTPLSGSAKETQLRIRNIFQGAKKRPPLWLMALVVLSILLCGGLVSCQGQSALPEVSGSTSSSGSQVRPASGLISMETQYYDDHGNYIEIPRLVPPNGQTNQAIDAINQELDQLREEYRPILDGTMAYYNPFGYGRSNNYCLFYPSATSRYLNLTLFQHSGGSSYIDGDVRAWVYDLEDERLVTLEDALALADTTQDELLQGLEDLLQSDPQVIHTVLQGPVIQGFRIREDNSVVFYIWVLIYHEELGKHGNSMDASFLYLWQEGGYTRYDCVSSSADLLPLVPAEETDQLSPALWNQWYFAGETPDALSTENPMDGLYALTPQARNAYANLLTSLLEGHVDPDGSYPVYLPEDSEYNRFAIRDVDNDGEEEMILLHAADVYAGFKARIFAYDQDSGGIRTELTEFPSLIFYDNGVVLAAWSHNQGWGGRFWPYNLYQYDKDSDSYVCAGSVDGWDRAISDQNEGFTPFPSELDVSGTEFLYYIEDSDGAIDRSTPVDASVYARWLDAYIGDSTEVAIPYLALTAENIQLLRAGPPPKG